MNSENEKTLFNQYTALMNVLGKALEEPHDAELIFWSLVCEMIDQSDMPYGAKLECLGILMEEFTGNHHLYDALVDICFSKKYNDAYERFNHKYRFAENLNEQGEYWKQLIWKLHVTGYRAVKDWLHIFVGEMMPIVNQKIAEYETERKEKLQFTEENFESRKRKYENYKKQMKRICKKMDQVSDVLQLMETDPDYLAKFFMINQKK